MSFPSFFRLGTPTFAPLRIQEVAILVKSQAKFVKRERGGEKKLKIQIYDFVDINNTATATHDVLAKSAPIHPSKDFKDSTSTTQQDRSAGLLAEVAGEAGGADLLERRDDKLGLSLLDTDRFVHR